MPPRFDDLARADPSLFISNTGHHNRFSGHRPMSNTGRSHYSAIAHYCIAETEWDAGQVNPPSHRMSRPRGKSLEGKFAEGYH